MYLLEDDKGNIRCFQQWPKVGIANKLAQQLTRLELEFGLTPSARTRVQVDKLPGSVDPRDAEFFGT